uniref:Uncharacterized protein n=1 Tax=Anguilla anguilla TaxID=7936 RepID=A0A0E9T4B6_ANGAN
MTASEKRNHRHLPSQTGSSSG